ncbi:SRPBCC family protein [Corynebacterium sp. S7]
MIRLDKTVIIHRPPREVFEFVSDLTHSPLWQADLQKVTRIGNAPLQVGTVHEFSRRFAGRMLTSRNTFVEFVQGKHVKFVMDKSVGTGWASYSVREIAPDSTELRSVLELKLLGATRLAEPLLSRSLERASVRQFASLKALLEAVDVPG